MILWIDLNFKIFYFGQKHVFQAKIFVWILNYPFPSLIMLSSLFFYSFLSYTYLKIIFYCGTYWMDYHSESYKQRVWVGLLSMGDRSCTIAPYLAPSCSPMPGCSSISGKQWSPHEFHTLYWESESNRAYCTEHIYEYK